MTDPDPAQADELPTNPELPEHANLSEPLESFEPRPGTSQEEENIRPPFIPSSARWREKRASKVKDEQSVTSQNADRTNETVIHATLSDANSESQTSNEQSAEPQVSQTGRPVRTAALKQRALLRTKLPDL